jgi:hypothetical protein
MMFGVNPKQNQQKQSNKNLSFVKTGRSRLIHARRVDDEPVTAELAEDALGPEVFVACGCDVKSI